MRSKQYVYALRPRQLYISFSDQPVPEIFADVRVGPNPKKLLMDVTRHTDPDLKVLQAVLTSSVCEHRRGINGGAGMSIIVHAFCQPCQKSSLWNTFTG